MVDETISVSHFLVKLTTSSVHAALNTIYVCFEFNDKRAYKGRYTNTHNHIFFGVHYSWTIGY